jgi:hypothetical protein
MSKIAITDNWISQVDSPTYKWTLYLVHPTVFNDPTRLVNDQATLRAGDAVIIAETGAEAAYSIENVLMLARPTPGATGGNTTNATVQFDIYEPLGFKLLDRVLKFAPQYKFTTLPDANYVLKLEFQGLDPETSKNTKFPGVFFYPLKVENMSAELGPEGAKYNIVAANIMKAASVESVVNTDLTIKEVVTVRDFATKLSEELNRYEVNLRKNAGAGAPDSKRYWKVVFGKSATTAVNKDSSEESFDLASCAYAGTANTTTAGGQSSSTTNPDTRDVTVSNNTNLVPWIQDQLTKNVTAFAEFAEQHRKSGIKVPYIKVTPTIEYGDSVDEFTNTREQTITITVDVNWSYTTVAREPGVHQQYVQDPAHQRARWKELPISKKYAYLYSGQNTEVMNFELKFSQLFFVSKDPAGGLNYSDASNSRPPTHPEKVVYKDSPNQSGAESARLSRSGTAQGTSEWKRTKYNDGAVVTSSGQAYLSDYAVDQANYVLETPQYAYSNLSPAKQQTNETKGERLSLEALRDREFANREVDFQNATISIKGDPYWMGTPGASLVGNVESINKYPDADVLFAFTNWLPDESVASVDNQAKGALDLISSGIYRVITIESRFQNGQFTQKLTTSKDRNTSVYLVRDLIVKL